MIVSLAALAAAGVLLFVLFSSLLGSTERPTLDHPAIVVLADTSADAKPWFRQEAKQLRDQAIDEASRRAGDVLADSVQADAASFLDLGCENHFRPSEEASATGNDQNVIDDLKAQAEKAKRSACDPFSRPRAASGSDLIGALEVAGRRLSQSDFAGRPRMVVLVSNLVQNTPDYRFGSQALTRHEVTRLINRRRQDEGLASLDGVRVVFVGAGIRQPPLKPQQQRGIRDFFGRYVQASGGRVALWAPRLEALPEP